MLPGLGQGAGITSIPSLLLASSTYPPFWLFKWSITVLIGGEACSEVRTVPLPSRSLKFSMFR